MSLKEPESVEECVYYTNRNFSGKGHAKVWVFRNECPKSHKSLMGKPVEKGKIKIRATEYICPECKYTIDKDEYEPTLLINIKYTCPHCSNSSELSTQFNRKKVTCVDEATGKKKSIEAVRFQCQKCSKNIDITKKMK